MMFRLDSCINQMSKVQPEAAILAKWWMPHQLGDWLSTKGLWNQVQESRISLNPTMYQNVYFGSVLHGYMTRTMITNTVSANATHLWNWAISFCNDFINNILLFSECFHGVGHGIFAIHSGLSLLVPHTYEMPLKTLFLVLHDCRVAPSQAHRKYCTHGALHSYFELLPRERVPLENVCAVVAQNKTRIHALRLFIEDNSTDEIDVLGLCEHEKSDFGTLPWELLLSINSTACY